MITSDAQLQAVLRMATSRAIDDVFTWAEKEVEKIILEAGASVNPTGGLSTAWVKEVHGLFGELRHDPNLMVVSAFGRHASPYDENWDDVREIFADIIQGGYHAWNKSGRKIPPRPFWDKFMNRFNSQFPKIFRNALRKQGLVVL